ncbi:putative RNA-directed DNA polymerase, eukaryota, reverse transcriptase zinc-binding domain protein [Tanacetum coccineum]
MCLHSARSPVLVNGSHSREFSIKRGLHQGDPLSPLLFIIVMEGLHLALKDEIDTSLLRGTNSHLYGLGVSSNDIEDMARDTGCTISYLGMSVGSNMNLIDNWQPLIDRLRAKLSSWKGSLLSIRGRLTLIKYVLGSMGSIICRFLKVQNPCSIRQNPFGHLSFGGVIHGVDAGLDLKGSTCSGIWSSIISTYSILNARDIIPSYTLRHKIESSTIHGLGIGIEKV